MSNAGDAPGLHTARQVKLIIQIPCFNEEATLRMSVNTSTSEVPVSQVFEWPVTEDCITDRTV